MSELGGLLTGFGCQVRDKPFEQLLLIGDKIPGRQLSIHEGQESDGSTRGIELPGDLERDQPTHRPAEQMIRSLRLTRPDRGGKFRGQFADTRQWLTTRLQTRSLKPEDRAIRGEPPREARIRRCGPGCPRQAEQRWVLASYFRERH